MSSLSTIDHTTDVVEVLAQKDDSPVEVDTRAKMSEYWNEFASATTVEGMMLDDGASLVSSRHGTL